MTEPASPRIRAARAHVRVTGSGNIGYIGALEFAVEQAERRITVLEAAGDALADSLAGAPGRNPVRDAKLDEWRKVLSGERFEAVDEDTARGDRAT